MPKRIPVAWWTAESPRIELSQNADRKTTLAAVPKNRSDAEYWLLCGMDAQSFLAVEPAC
jgi:hypothetical protein